MKAVIRTSYGPPEVLQVTETEKPIPADNQVLVEVHAASINKSDWYQVKPHLLARLLSGGIRKPKDEMLGGDLAGKVVAVGKAVTKFKVGDDVFGTGRGSLAEYACAREVRLVIKPPNVTFEEAAAIPIAGITALQGLRKGGVIAGESVLIDGASGGVGTFVVQIAKSFGAVVTAVCSPQNVAQARAMGADQVIDYTASDFAKDGQKYELILGVNGDHSVFGYRRALRSGGRYLLVGSSKIWSSLLQTLLLGWLISKVGGRKIGFMGIAKITPEDLEVLRGLLETGKVQPVIDRRFPLMEAAEAFRYLGEGHAKGKVVVTVNHSA